MKIKKQHIDNTQFLKDMIEWLDERKHSNDENYPVSNKIASTLELLIKHFLKRPNFSSYTYKERMISDATYLCIRYAKNFDPTISKNPFSYFTQITYHAFIRVIELEKKESELKDTLIKKMQAEMINDVEYLLEEKHNDLPRFSHDYREEEFAPVTLTENGITTVYNTKEEWDEYVKLLKEMNEMKQLVKEDR